jgi:hypothetical protein
MMSKMKYDFLVLGGREAWAASPGAVRCHEYFDMAVHDKFNQGPWHHHGMLDSEFNDSDIIFMSQKLTPYSEQRALVLPVLPVTRNLSGVTGHVQPSVSVQRGSHRLRRQGCHR